ncbi:hypothetical protein [Streptomyces microflavus]|uniref:hypothetical protein n=1 Tax=Streptomyces microflavus TaxID=1919 RepID=UPI003402C095
MVVQRFGGVVQWSDWQVPKRESAPPEFHFEGGAYDAELARVGRTGGGVFRARPTGQWGGSA